MRSPGYHVPLFLLASAVTSLIEVRPAPATVRAVPVPYATIQAALDSCADYDTVLVAPGIYNEPVEVPARPLTLASRDGDPLTTILDGSGAGMAGHDQVVLVNQTSRGPQEIRGLTIRRGAVGLYCNSGAFPGTLSYDLVIRHSRFVENGPTGALYHAGGQLTLLDNEFVEDQVTGDGLQGAVVNYGSATIERNLFQRNRSGVAGGAIYSVWGNQSLNQNEFVANEAPHGSALELVSNDPVSLVQNTILGGTENPSGEAIRVEKSSGSITLDYNIVAFDAGVGVRWVQGFGTVSCNDVYGNAGGDWVGTRPFGSVTTFAADPLFCDRAGGVLTLAANSPCLPAAHPCDGTFRVGALGEGCDAVAVRAVTWGGLKAMFGAR